MPSRHYGAACFVAVVDGQMQLVIAGGRPSYTVTEYYSLSDGTWKKGAELPRGYFSGGYATYSDSRGSILIGGVDEVDYYHDDILRFIEVDNRFETLPTKLNIGRWDFAIILTEYPEEC